MTIVVGYRHFWLHTCCRYSLLLRFLLHLLFTHFLHCFILHCFYLLFFHYLFFLHALHCPIGLFDLLSICYHWFQRRPIARVPVSSVLTCLDRSWAVWSITYVTPFPIMAHCRIAS